MKKTAKTKLSEISDVPVAETQKMTYTFHINDRKIVIEATGRDEAERMLHKLIKNK